MSLCTRRLYNSRIHFLYTSINCSLVRCLAHSPHTGEPVVSLSDSTASSFVAGTPTDILGCSTVCVESPRRILLPAKQPMLGNRALQQCDPPLPAHPPWRYAFYCIGVTRLLDTTSTRRETGEQAIIGANLQVRIDTPATKFKADMGVITRAGHYLCLWEAA